MHMFVILFVVCEVFANYDFESESPNVGTVLFKHSDANSRRWNRANLSLLQARKMLQKLIPSPHLIETINEDYIANLLKYFQNSYSAVKRDIKNPALHNIMNIALSDALGGYLKVWVLPITKYAFYSGTVSLDKATSIFQVYEDIKSKLKTNGDGWRSPNKDLLNSVAINIGSPPRSSFARSMKDSCKQLSFYEKIESGLTVPLPVINWSIYPMMMFVPLKNQSMVPLTSQNSSKILMNYYNIAKNCMHSQSDESLDQFNLRFQTWIVSDVAPHLNDDNLYIAFDSILTLINKTKNLYGKVSNALDDKYFEIKCKAISLGLPLHLTSKKYLILFLILLIEIIWCVPTLICLIRSRRKRQRQKSEKKFFGKFFKRKPTYHLNKFCTLHEDIKEDNEKRGDCSRGLKLFLKPRTRNLEVDVQFPPYDCMMTKSSSSQSQYNNTSSEQITVVNDTSLKNILPEFDSVVVDNPKKELSKINMSKGKKTNEMKGTPLISDEIIESTKTLTLIKDSERTIKQFLYSEETITPQANIIKSRSKCKCTLESTSINQNYATKCTCTPCISYDKNGQKETKKVTYTDPPTRFGRFRRKEKTQCETIMRTLVDNKSLQKQTITETSNININSSKNTKVSTGHPLLSIKIDRPKTEIKVGISSYRKGSEDSKKLSKIPRLAFKDAKADISSVDATAGVSTEIEYPRNKNSDISSSKHKQKKDLASDDNAVQRTSKDKKINITL